LHLSVVGRPIDGAGDEFQVGTGGLFSECYFSIVEHVNDINNRCPIDTASQTPVRGTVLIRDVPNA
jgi:hypothetical protein